MQTRMPLLPEHIQPHSLPQTKERQGAIAHPLWWLKVMYDLTCICCASAPDETDAGHRKIQAVRAESECFKLR